MRTLEIYPAQRTEEIGGLAPHVTYMALYDRYQELGNLGAASAAEATYQAHLRRNRSVYHHTMSLDLAPATEPYPRVTFRGRRCPIPRERPIRGEGPLYADWHALQEPNLHWRQTAPSRLDLIPKLRWLGWSFEPAIATVNTKEMIAIETAEELFLHAASLLVAEDVANVNRDTTSAEALSSLAPVGTVRPDSARLDVYAPPSFYERPIYGGA